MRKDLFINLIGIILIIVGIYRLLQIIYIAEDFPRYFWLCNSSPLIAGFAILFRSSFVLIGEFSIIFIPQFLWSLDFFYFLFTKNFPIGSSMYVLNETLLSQIASISVHFLVLPLSLTAIFLIGKESKRAWKFSFVLFSILIPIILYYGREYNLNFFFQHNLGFLPIISFYSVIFPIFYILLVVFPVNLLINFLIRKFKK
ncbi:MAG: hypothetical protein Q8P15_02075 [Nanoarchaeota archaeon]|nr:hypothetical protein [Nanoarchaeota archaeon]